MNKIIISGNLGNDPTCSVSTTGVEYADFSVAVSREIAKDKIKEDTVTTDWFRCIVFGQKVSNFVKPYMKKGDRVLVEGVVRFDNYTNKEGQNINSCKILASNIELLNFKGGKNEETVSEEPKQDTLTPIQDDDLPF